MNLEEKINLLKEKIVKIFPKIGVLETEIKGFKISIGNETTQDKCYFCEPMAVLILQGKKQITFESKNFICNENQLIITSVNIPIISRIIEANTEKPFISLIINLDNYIINQLLIDCEHLQCEISDQCIGVIDINEDILDAFYRLILLLQQKERQKIMAPMIIKEIHYLLLISSIGNIICSFNMKNSNNKIANIIKWLKNNYKKPLKINKLAKKFNITESSLYRNFNKVTKISPLQYQKKLRLYEAHRLIISENFNVANAAYEVGYESPSQFNREYKKIFGVTPKTNTRKTISNKKI